MINVTELLKKERISGEDAGRLLIYNDVLIYKKQLGVGSDGDEPITQEAMNSVMDRINTIEDAEILECYVQLHNFIRYAQAISYAYNQQAQNGFCRLLMYMTQAQQVEHARKNLELLPMIMTETQFREMPPPGPLARQRGVAIVANNFPCRPMCLDSNDYFIEPEIDCFQEMMSLEHAEGMAEKIEYFRNDLMLSGLRYQTAYNRLFELIAERIRIPDFKVFCTDTQEILDQISEFNQQRNALANEIAGEGELYYNRKRILDDIFRPIDLCSIYISDEAAEKARKMLEDINIFRTSVNELLAVLLGDRRD